MYFNFLDGDMRSSVKTSIEVAHGNDSHFGLRGTVGTLTERECSDCGLKASPESAVLWTSSLYRDTNSELREIPENSAENVVLFHSWRLGLCVHSHT